MINLLKIRKVIVNKFFIKDKVLKTVLLKYEKVYVSINSDSFHKLAEIITVSA